MMICQFLFNETTKQNGCGRFMSAHFNCIGKDPGNSHLVSWQPKWLMPPTMDAWNTSDEQTGGCGPQLTK